MGVFCAKMTSTQRSESANHLLKGYVPPGCPMNLFVRQYEKLQFDRDSEESFQEKRTSLSGVHIRFNLAIERHASQIYTRSMFEQFEETLYKANAYVLDVVIPKREYIATHVDASARETWSKVQYKVEVAEDESFFSCECGIFEHSGMVCCHSLKVMIELRLTKLPDKHVLKRWTSRDARDVLPEHLTMYQRDKGPPASDTYRHHTMYVKALECVRLGDSNVKCYEVFMAMMKEVSSTLLPLSVDKDGMGLAERENAEKMMDVCDATTSVVSGMQCAVAVGLSGASSSMGAPKKSLPPGRPTNSRNTAPYEQNQKAKEVKDSARFVEAQVTRAQHALSEGTYLKLQGDCQNVASAVCWAIAETCAARLETRSSQVFFRSRFPVLCDAAKGWTQALCTWLSP